MLRRVFLKVLGVSPLAFLWRKPSPGGLPKAETSVVTANATEPLRGWANAETKVIRVWWDGRWWRSFGSRISWTRQQRIWLEMPNRTEFTEYYVLPTLDWCADMRVYKDYLIWLGKSGEMWQIEYRGDVRSSMLPYQFRKVDCWERL